MTKKKKKKKGKQLDEVRGATDKPQWAQVTRTHSCRATPPPAHSPWSCTHRKGLGPDPSLPGAGAHTAGLPPSVGVGLPVPAQCVLLRAPPWGLRGPQTRPPLWVLRLLRGGGGFSAAAQEGCVPSICPASAAGEPAGRGGQTHTTSWS